MNESQINEYRDYAWEYFSLHADHRLKAFNFFVAFATLLIGAFATLVEKSGLRQPYILLPLAFVFVSFVFWKLEERTRMLVKNGEDAIKYLDSLVLGNDTEHYKSLALFTADDRLTSNLPKFPLLSGYFSYSRCFRWVYMTCGVIGFIGAIVCIGI